MVCEHLKQLESDIIAAGIEETYRGSPWGEDSREWVYFACWLDPEKITDKYSFPGCVSFFEHGGTLDGAESGFECKTCKDGVMGYHKLYAEGKTVFPERK